MALALAGMASCVSTPITGRQAFNLLPIEDDMELGAQAYADTLAEVRLADGHPQAAMVRGVVDRLVPVAQAHLPVVFDWEVHVIDDPQTVNAWCMPGGKMAVYTGILPVTRDETGLAVVMGHEIGHAIARHGTERMTQQVGAQLVLDYIAGDYSELASEAAQLLVFLPWGRSQELEADHIGLMLMADAGYDPREAVGFWQRMAAASGGAPPEFLSTHPSDTTRIEQLAELMPEALERYQAATGTGASEIGKP
jgi:predicted Zn-dependent protease